MLSSVVQRLRLVSCLRNYTTLNRLNIVAVQKQFFLPEKHCCSNFSTETTKMASKPLEKTNRLAKEKSPYLLQHKNNPVDWYPWGDEAIQKAKSENKLIFLSVGYSTCHWCHVMEHESFENAEVAKIMNEHYVNIKVDREERPDIDKIYMTFLLMINGSGGWPMSVWLTPDLAPVTAGTYFPPMDRWGMPGFKTVLLKIVDKWRENGDELATTGMNIMQAIQKNAAEKGEEESGETLSIENKFHQAISIYKRNSDKEWGGFGRAPKFPEVSKINLLFHCHFKKPDCQVIDLVLLTLTKMANGGIHDHIFGGFARYSVDQKWHIPHFEKMLYDQGQLLSAYSNAYRLTRNAFFLDICDNIVQYLCTDLKHPGGGFYSGEDADSLPTAEDKDKIEGAFYAWTYSEVQEAFRENSNQFKAGTVDPFIVYAHHYDIREAGNVEPSSDPHGHLEGKNILFVKGDIEETSRKFEMEPIEVDELLRNGNKILYEIRCKRPRPHLDTKIICAWNGLVLSGLSKLACIKDAPKRQEYLATAKNLVDFIKKNLYDEKNKVLMRSCYGEGTQSEAASMLDDPIAGFLDDYAFLIKGLLDYYVATLDKDVLHWAKELQDSQDKLFWDDKNSGYFYSQADAPNVIIRLKEDHDGAEPCGNSMAVHNLLLLSCYFEESHYKERAKQIFDFFENATPFGYVLPHMMSGLIMYDFGLEMLVVVGPENDESAKLIETVRDFFIPGLVPFHLRVEEPIDSLTRKSVQQFKMVGAKPTVYVCHNQVCQLPITEVDALAESLGKKYIYKCDY